VQAQARTLRLAQEQMMVNVASAYYDILRDQMLVEVNTRALERAKLLQQAAEAKLKVGMASKMDVFRAELQALTAENGVVDIQASLTSSQQNLNVLLGVDLARRFTLTTTLAYQPITIDAEALRQQALANRLEIQAADADVADAERQLKIARQNLSPQLDVSLQYKLSGEGNGFKKSLGLQDGQWGIGVSSSLDLNRTSERTAYRKAQLAYNDALRAVQTTEQDVTLEVLQTVTSVNQAQAGVELQEQSVRQAEQQLELADLRYKKGLSDNLDVITAEGDLMEAKTSYYAAIVQHLIAKMKLHKVTGALTVPQVTE